MIGNKDIYDKIGFGGLILKQSSKGFRYGVDAVLLADFASVTKAEDILDLGTGNGVIPLILLRKTSAEKIIGVEIQKEQFDLAVENAKINALESQTSFLHSDIKDIDENIKVGCVVSNPPYIQGDSGIYNRNDSMTISRIESSADLECFINVASKHLYHKGDFFLIHRPSRLVDIFYHARNCDLEPKRIKFIYPKPHAAPNLVLVHCIKNGGSELLFDEALTVYEESGEYSEALKNIYDHTLAE